MAWLNSMMRSIFRWRMREIRKWSAHPIETQQELLRQFLNQNRHTEWGQRFDFQSITSPQIFAERMPVQNYETLKGDIARMMHGERDVLWTGQVQYFAKSSGTTSDKSKFIPVTRQNLRGGHLKGGWDGMTLLYDKNPNTTFFEGKMLLMGGSLQPFEPFPATQFGDVSAIMLSQMPTVGQHIYVPRLETALQPNTESKIEQMAHLLAKEDMRIIGGVPTWTVVLIRRILELTGKSNLLEVWPNLQGYGHGGVSFEPYREQFKQFIPKADFIYWENYNASEGFFAGQCENGATDMLLYCDNGVYYEFLPESEWEKPFPQSIPLQDVQIGKNYAIVITTNAGLWRYTPGDSVQFTSKFPFKIKVSGRTNQFVNAFGEEVMVSNTDMALAETCRSTGAMVAEYTVAPIYFNGKGKGGHQWLVEFDKEPATDIETFNNLLDTNLQKVNSDYEAKRFKSLAMDRLALQSLPKGTFHRWLSSKGKYGGQHKVPRLANHRRYVEEILHFTTI
jgi:hypothetical protein